MTLLKSSKKKFILREVFLLNTVTCYELRAIISIQSCVKYWYWYR